MSSNGSKALRVYPSLYRFSNENYFNIFMTKLNYLNVQLIYNSRSQWAALTLLKQQSQRRPQTTLLRKNARNTEELN